MHICHILRKFKSYTHPLKKISKYITGQFIHACVVITPLDQGSNRVEIQCKPELNEPLEHIKVRK